MGACLAEVLLHSSQSCKIVLVFAVVLQRCSMRDQCTSESVSIGPLCAILLPAFSCTAPRARSGDLMALLVERGAMSRQLARDDRSMNNALDKRH